MSSCVDRVAEAVSTYHLLLWAGIYIAEGGIKLLLCTAILTYSFGGGAFGGVYPPIVSVSWRLLTGGSLLVHNCPPYRSYTRNMNML